jgi:hypothetical protein
MTAFFATLALMGAEHWLFELAAIPVWFDVCFILSAFVLVCLLIGSIHPPFRSLLKTQGRRIWTISRQVVGWLLIIIGILGMILPGPGIPFFILGVLLVGRRHPLLRRGWVILRLHLRNLARRPGVNSAYPYRNRLCRNYPQDAR